MASIDFQSIGAFASNSDSSSLAPGAPAGVVTGNLLVAATGNRAASQTISTPTGWTILSLTTERARVYGRIADGTGDDTPTFDWSGSNDSYAVLLRYDGDVPADIADLVPSGGATQGGGTAGGNSVPVEGTTAPTVTDALVFAVSQKSKTSSSNGAVITVTTEFTLRGELTIAGTSLMIGVADWQQTGAGVNYDGDDWTHDQGADALAYASDLIYFEPESGGIVPQAMHHYRHHGG